MFMASTPETEVAKATTNGHARPLSPTEKARRISEGMKRAHAENPSAWGRPDIAKRDDKIRAAIQANPGLSYREIADKVGVHKSRVYRVLRMDGVPLKRGAGSTGPRAKNPRVEAMREKIRALVAKGFNGRVIQKKLGVSDKQIQLAKNFGAKNKAAAQGLPSTPTGKSTNAEATAARHEAIRKLLAQGLHPKAVAARLGLNVGTVYYARAKSAGQAWPSMEKRQIARQQHVGMPMAETLNWLKHASQEAYKAIRAGREPSLAEMYAILAYRAAVTGDRP
jgi:transposase